MKIISIIITFSLYGIISCAPSPGRPFPSSKVLYKSISKELDFSSSDEARTSGSDNSESSLTTSGKKPPPQRRNLLKVEKMDISKTFSVKVDGSKDTMIREPTRENQAFSSIGRSGSVSVGFLRNPIQAMNIDPNLIKATSLSMKARAQLFLGNFNNRNSEAESERTTSSLQTKVKLFADNSLGNFDFTTTSTASRTSTTTSAPIRKKIKALQGDEIFGLYIGEYWSKTEWADIKAAPEKEIHTSIVAALKRLAPNTMTNIPSLSPKKIYEKEVLESWLISALLAAYPTLRDIELTKNDAITLILLILFSKVINKFADFNLICSIISDLKKYDGNVSSEKIDLDRFDIILTLKEDNIPEIQIILLEALFKIIYEKNLKCSLAVIKSFTAENK